MTGSQLPYLKSQALNFSPSRTSPPSTIDTIERAKLPSREDILTARLKSLRNEESDSVVSTPSGGSRKPSNLSPTKENAQPQSPEGTESETRERLGTSQSAVPTTVPDDIDPLLFTDDETLEELLEDLRSDETWLDEIATQEEEHQRVTALLDELGKAPDIGANGDDIQKDNDSSSDDDNSDGEAMTKETESVLANALDEVEWEKTNKASSPISRSVSTTPLAHENDARPDTNQEPNSKAPNNDALDLPEVPSKLLDPPDKLTSSTETQSDSDFAASIASRMAALKLSGDRALPSAPTDDVDELGLPVAPTFAPADRPVPGLAKRGGGLTDEDQKTWCVVCLVDGAVRCLDCEVGDNIYCARCWKEMHVGPRAGYDERSHSWETFVSRNR